MAPTRRKSPKQTPTATTTHGKSDTPSSMVFSLAHAPAASLAQLVHDIRDTMEPNTATRLKMGKANTVKDVSAIAGELGVTHFLVLNQNTNTGTVTLQIARHPRGPTLVYKVDGYTLSKDVRNSQKKPKPPGNEYKVAPLLILHGFEDSKEDAVSKSLLQSLLPNITLDKRPKRVVLLEKTSEGIVSFRHYAVDIKVRGKINKILKTLPEMDSYMDVADYVLGGACASESEGEATGAKGEEAVILRELGPRMDLRLSKILEGTCKGNRLFEASNEQNSAPEKLEID